MNAKEYFFDQVVKDVVISNIDQPVRVLELGCGTAPYVPELIKKYPNLHYVGLEPIRSSFAVAEKTLESVPRTKVVNQLGYESIAGVDLNSFDIAISFSVLEHVKQLGPFLELSYKYLRSGGVMVHRYDLGHALYPGDLKEKFHVWLGNTFPSILPERSFVRYLPLSEVVAGYEALLGHSPYRYTYHQMPNTKLLTKELRKQGIDESAMEEICAWEFKYSEQFSLLPVNIREKLFPTIAVWGRKS